MQELDKFSRIFRGNLNRLMGEKGISQKELADYMGVSTTAVSRWLSGQKMPRVNKIERLCEFFGVTQTELMSEQGLYKFPALSELELRTIENFRKLTAENQQVIAEVVTAFLSRQMLATVGGFVQNNLNELDGAKST